jgi:D-inositol-3-phosphate glycosyltransferase
VAVIPNGIDLNLFDAAEELDARKKFGLSPDRLMIFFSGRMERRKGVHLLGEIAASVLARPDVELVLAGDDLFGYAERELLPSLRAKPLRGSVRFLGKLDAVGCDLPASADVFLIPSLWENCPYACLEAWPLDEPS